MRPIKRWDNIRNSGYTLAQLENGEFAWLDSTGCHAGGSPANVWLHTWDPSSVVHEAVLGRLSPTWDAKQETLNVKVGGTVSALIERCIHDGTKTIGNLFERWDPYIFKDGQRMQRYSAPLEEQMKAIESRLVASVLRTLSEVPLCNVTGQRVNVVTMQDHKRGKLFATFRCDACEGGKFNV